MSFADVVHDHPACAWCKLPVRVGELLVFAQIGSRAYGYVHEFCVGKIPAQKLCSVCKDVNTSGCVQDDGVCDYCHEALVNV